MPFTFTYLLILSLFLCIMLGNNLIFSYVDLCSGTTNSYVQRRLVCSIMFRISWVHRFFQYLFNHNLWTYFSTRPDTEALFCCQTRLLIVFTHWNMSKQCSALFIVMFSSCPLSLRNYKLLVKKTLPNSSLHSQYLALMSRFSNILQFYSEFNLALIGGNFHQSYL